MCFVINGMALQVQCGSFLALPAVLHFVPLFPRTNWNPREARRQSVQGTPEREGSGRAEGESMPTRTPGHHTPTGILPQRLCPSPNSADGPCRRVGMASVAGPF